MNMKYVKRFLLVLLILFVFTLINFFVIRGHYEFRFMVDPDKTVNAFVSFDRDDILEITDIYVSKKNMFCVKVKAVGSGAVNMTVHYGDPEMEDETRKIRVTRLGIIYEEGYLGSVGNLMILRYEMAFLFLVTFINLFIALKKIKKINPYSYANMYYIGALVFAGVNLFFWLLSIVLSTNVWKDRLFMLFSEITSIFSRLPMILFPAVVIFSILLIISNIVLIKKEGFALHNMLGIGLGFVLTFMTVFTFFLYSLMDNIIDVHSYRGMHVELFFELAFFGILSYLESMLIGTIIGSLKAQRAIPDFDRDYMIILGCGLKKDGTVTPLLKGRADRAIWFAEKQKEKTGKDLVFVSSGGQGEDEAVPEAVAVKNYLLSCGVEEDRILTEEKSCSTYENMKFSKQVIQDNNKQQEPARIAFSTTDYHVFRSGHLANELGLNALGVGARTKWYFYMNAQIREFAANLNAQKIRHILNVTYIVVMLASMMALSYFYSIL